MILGLSKGNKILHLLSSFLNILIFFALLELRKFLFNKEKFFFKSIDVINLKFYRCYC